MKPLFRLLLSALSFAMPFAAIIASVSTSCLRSVSPTADPDKNRLLVEDLNRYYVISHELRHRYESYADRASADSNRTAAGLFSALARSEHIHENACSRAVSLLKGRCADNRHCRFDISDTKGNLRRSLDEERSRFLMMQGKAVDRAIDAGNYYTARILIWIDGTNRRHIELIERCLALTEENGHCDCCRYHVCPVCGNIYESDNCDTYCPLCRTSSSKFECFGSMNID